MFGDPSKARGACPWTERGRRWFPWVARVQTSTKWKQHANKIQGVNWGFFQGAATTLITSTCQKETFQNWIAKISGMGGVSFFVKKLSALFFSSSNTCLARYCWNKISMRICRTSGKLKRTHGACMHGDIHLSKATWWTLPLSCRISDVVLGSATAEAFSPRYDLFQETYIFCALTKFQYPKVLRRVKGHHNRSWVFQQGIHSWSINNNDVLCTHSIADLVGEKDLWINIVGNESLPFSSNTRQWTLSISCTFAWKLYFIKGIY